MKVTVEVLCVINKVVITTPFDKFDMEYTDELGLELFSALLLNNSFLMVAEAKAKFGPQWCWANNSLVKDYYGREAAVFIVDGKKYDIFDVSLSDSDIEQSMSKIQEKLSTKNGRLCLR